MKPTPEQIQAFITSLNKELPKGKGRVKHEPTDNDVARERNRKFHDRNPQLGKTSGKTPERLDPEDSTHWYPVARVTYVAIQECSSCGDCTDYICGEFIKYRSIFGLNGGEILRQSKHAPNVFLYSDLEKPLEDLVEWQYEKTTRCAGCIKVEQQAQQVIWQEHLRRQLSAVQSSLDFNLEKPIGRSIDEALEDV